MKKQGESTANHGRGKGRLRQLKVTRLSDWLEFKITHINMLWSEMSMLWYTNTHYFKFSAPKHWCTDTLQQHLFQGALGVLAGSRLAPRGKKLLQQTTRLTRCSREVGFNAGEGQDSGSPAPQTQTLDWNRLWLLSGAGTRHAAEFSLHPREGRAAHTLGIMTQEHFYIICDFSTNSFG